MAPGAALYRKLGWNEHFHFYLKVSKLLKCLNPLAALALLKVIINKVITARSLTPCVPFLLIIFPSFNTHNSPQPEAVIFATAVLFILEIK